MTRPFVFSGRKLAINFATSSAGSLRFELQKAEGHPWPGLALADCQEQIGNEIERIVTWKSNNDLGKIAGQVVRLHCWCKDADLFALQFKD